MYRTRSTKLVAERYKTNLVQFIIVSKKQVVLVSETSFLNPAG